MKRDENKRRRFHIKKDDQVVVLIGDASGDVAKRTGRVLKVIREKNRAIVEGQNLVTKHFKKTEQGPGKIEKIEAPIHISNLMLVENGVPTRVGYKADDKGELKRYSKRSGNFI